MKLDALVSQIQGIDAGIKVAAGHAVNRMLTIRNWLIGHYIVQYEQGGEDRAQYGDGLLKELSRRADIKGLSVTNLKLNRQFYVAYPHIGQTVSDLLSSHEIWRSLPAEFQIGQTVSDQFAVVKSDNQVQQSPIAKFQLSGEEGLSIQSHSSELTDNELMVPPRKLISSLSFSHLVELLSITDPLKRTFYEVEAIKGTWSVRELKRQIGSLYFERSGLSVDPARLSAITQGKTAPQKPEDIVKSVYAFEFLGLPTHLAVEEEHLETALLDHIQQFILELGEGFCFEARQKRILIGDEYFFIDLVFYHRILKCHVLIDLKVEAFTHHMAGQLNTYLNYYKKEVVPEGDNPPIGILLVTDKNRALVEYATAGMDEGMFVKKYLLQLPKVEALEAFILEEVRKW